MCNIVLLAVQFVWCDFLCLSRCWVGWQADTNSCCFHDYVIFNWPLDLCPNEHVLLKMISPFYMKLLETLYKSPEA